MKVTTKIPTDILIMFRVLNLMQFSEKVGHPLPEDLEDKAWCSAGRVVLKNLFTKDFVWFPTFSPVT